MDYQDLDVMVLTYNRSKYLRIALTAICESVATWRKTIILNNASTDDTLDVVGDIQREYPNRVIEVITYSENVGNVGNFKKSQEYAQNKYVAVFHDDDAVHPEYIDRAMFLLHKNDNAVMASGGVEGLYNVASLNWNILPSSYYLYPQNYNTFLFMMIDRPTFCSNIYKTDIYRRMPIEYEKYGKLWDNPFMFGIGNYGDIIFLHGGCIRWRQSLVSDSNSLKTGPFPDEILNIVSNINLLYASQSTSSDKESFYERVLFKTALFNFSYFLFMWSCLYNYIEWDDFKDKMLRDEIFSERAYFLFDRIIDLILNPAIRRMSKKLREKFYLSYNYRVGGV